MKLLNRLRVVFNNDAARTVKASGKAATEPASERRKNRRVDARKGTRVLIIDDSPKVLTYLKKVFASAGYVPLIAGNAERGLNIARSQHPDLVVMDVILPGMDGFATLRHIRRDPVVRDLPVIMMSGTEQASEQIYVKRIGADGFIRKPFSRFELFSHIEPMLDQDRVPRRTRA